MFGQWNDSGHLIFCSRKEMGIEFRAFDIHRESYKLTYKHFICKASLLPLESSNIQKQNLLAS